MADEPVRVAHDSGFPPFAEVKDGKSEGLAVDIFRAVAARARVDVKFVPVSFEQRQLTWRTAALEGVSTPCNACIALAHGSVWFSVAVRCRG